MVEEVNVRENSDRNGVQLLCCPSYPTKEQVIGAWVGYIITNIILNALFPHVWWVFIPVIILFFGAIGKTIRYCHRLYICPRCHYVHAGPNPYCKECGQPLRQIDNLHNRFHARMEAFGEEMRVRGETFRDDFNDRTRKIQEQGVNQNTQQTVKYVQTNDSAPKIKSEMNFCPNCGTELSHKGIYCPLCGQKL
jgi:hypothetical protein